MTGMACVRCDAPTEWTCGPRYPSGSDGWLFPFCEACKELERNDLQGFTIEQVTAIREHLA